MQYAALANNLPFVAIEKLGEGKIGDLTADARKDRGLDGAGPLHRLVLSG